MSIAINKQIVCDFLGHMNAGDTEAGLSLLADDAIWWAPGDRKGGSPSTKQQMRGFIGAFYRTFATRPVLKVIELTAEEDRVSARVSMEGGVTCGGLEYGNDVHMLVRIRDGLILEVREYLNTSLLASIIPEIKAVSA